jgi:hypothetical protein
MYDTPTSCVCVGMCRRSSVVASRKSYCDAVLVPESVMVGSTAVFRRFAMEAGLQSYYLVYDFMDGGDLTRALSTGQGLSEWERVKVCEGFEFGFWSVADASACFLFGCLHVCVCSQLRVGARCRRC